MKNLALVYKALPALVVVLLCACASKPPPNEELAVGRAAVERATGPAAADAPTTLASAREKLDRANAAYANKEYDRARQLASEATADADLAEAQARSVRSEKALNEVREGIRQLRSEMIRK
jgi:hypothetical protein